MEWRQQRQKLDERHLSITTMPFSVVGLASLKLTVVSLVLLGCGGIVLLYSNLRPTVVLLVPFVLLGINLIAAMFVFPAFRRNTALQAFHLALLAVLILAAFSRLTYFKGQFELSAGERFTGRVMASEKGPWHVGAWDQVDFINEGAQVLFRVGGKRGPTHNAVRWLDAQGQTHRHIIGDNAPLRVHGYRIYPSTHFGYAPLFSWRPSQGATPSRGTVHLPSLHMGSSLSNTWTLPDTGISALVMLQPKHPVPDTLKETLFIRGGAHTLLVTIRGESRVMRPGDTWSMPEGILSYESLETWMGYTVFYDQTIPWLLASALIAVTSLAFHFKQKFTQKPWQTVAS